MAKIVTITINPSDASFTVDNTGFQGKGCAAIIKAFAEIGEITKEVHKSEYDRPVKTTNTVTVGR